MKNILVIGSVGQIGSELTMRLRKIYGILMLLPVTVKHCHRKNSQNPDRWKWWMLPMRKNGRSREKIQDRYHL